ncbi:YwqG family protein [Bacillus mesophilum]|uniref:DUF1963 domain-containing protein n=1 Tax=Bacillus mesophilum TaxID=1071718 RepID=A0A7V7RLI8_9BACI|nr:YwqG family protein [Bacillus mesophilum]KAB2332620.1 DUF1963 domain-containing protein [Bacillus mesophilum]
MNLATVLDEMKKKAIKLELQTDHKEELPLGASKIGGNPDLPKDFNWFYYEGEAYTGEIKNRPLSFLAQINCGEVRMYDEEGLLPKKGILYFFYELLTMTWGYDPQHRGSAKVFYFDGDLSELSRTPFPDDMENECKIPEIPLHFSQKYNVPDYGEFMERHDYRNLEEFLEVKADLGYEQEEVMSKLLGYADIIQNGMLLQCELVTNGTELGMGYPDMSSEEYKILQQKGEQWQLLFQLDTVIENDYELMFGDSGRIYYYIKKEDLKNCRFDDCWLVLECY